MIGQTQAPLRRLIERHGVVDLTNGAVGSFIAEGTTLLFFTGDCERYPEIDDVAIVLPEILKAFLGRFKAGLIDPDADPNAAARFDVIIRPSLVFVHDGQSVGMITRMRDWAVYLDEIGTILCRIDSGDAQESRSEKSEDLSR